MTRGLFQSRIERRFLRFRRTGDPAALAAVFDATAPQVLRVAMHLSRDPAAAEDVVQRTFLTAIESAASFDGSRRLLPWLLGIASNHAKEAARKAARTPDPERLPRREAPSPQDAALAAEALSAAGDALDALEDPARSILVLRFRHGLEPAEIADALGLPPATVRSHLHRGTERLRRGLPRGLALPAAFLGTPPRGLVEVRHVVLDRAKEAGPALAAATAAAVAAPLVIGGLIVNKTLVAAAAAVLCLVGGGFWIGSTISGDSAPGAGSPAPAPAAPPSLAKAERPAAQVAVPAAGAPAPKGGILDVRVTDSDGAPAARVGILVGSGEVGVHVVTRTVTTDAEGRSRIEGLAAGKVLLSLTSGGKYVDVPAEGTTVVELRTARGVTIEGEVVDADDRPVPRAEVWVERDSSRWQRVFQATTTDERGRFRIRDVERWASLAARSQGRAPSLTRRVLGTEGETERVRLTLGGPAGRVQGRVRGPMGLPVAGAFVLVGSAYGVPATLPDGTQGSGALPLLARTGEDGTFVAGDWPAGVTFVTVRARGHAGVRTVLTVLPHPDVTEWVVDLEPAVIVEGTVTLADGRPAAGAVVRSYGYVEASWQWTATTGPDGRYRLDGLPVLTQQTLGFRADAEDGSATAWFGVGTVRAGETVRRDVELRRPERLGIDVRVVSEGGDGLEGFRVGAFDVHGLGIQEKAGAKTDARGRARIEGLDAEAYRLEAVDPSGDPWMPCASVEGVRPGDSEATIRVLDAVRPRGRLLGNVVTAGGEIPTGTRAWVFPKGRSHGLNLTLDRATGRVQSAALPPGAYELTVDAPGYGAAKFGWKTLASEDVDLGTLRLETPGRLLVHCRAGERAAATGMGLSADAGNGIVWGRLRPDGTAPFEVMQPGRYRIRMSGGIWGASAVTWAVVESGKKTEIEMTLVPGFARRFRVEARRPEDLFDVRVRVRERAEDDPVDERLIPLVRDGAVQGDFTLAPGRWLFEATSGTGLRAEATVEVRGDGEPVVVLKLAK